MLFVSISQFGEFVLLVPKTEGSAGLDSTEPKLTSTALPFWASHERRTSSKERSYYIGSCNWSCYYEEFLLHNEGSEGVPVGFSGASFSDSMLSNKYKWGIAENHGQQRYNWRLTPQRWSSRLPPPSQHLVCTEALSKGEGNIWVTGKRININYGPRMRCRGSRRSFLLTPKVMSSVDLGGDHNSEVSVKD